MDIGLNVLIIILYYGISLIILKPRTRGLRSLKAAGVVLLVSTILMDQHAKFNFDQAKDWDNTERMTNVATTWINSVSFAVGQFAGATTSHYKEYICYREQSRT